MARVLFTKQTHYKFLSLNITQLIPHSLFISIIIITPKIDFDFIIFLSINHLFEFFIHSFDLVNVASFQS
ncbi:hypothetical protein L6452_43003 [Arctium lappa]|uniref:Uncharacterized protein n=1 Tax=Arctium lappa TaxID=4217 RepID=A0ACB8XK25_ARCLA|nr:hypothetical protein L6452_43003 [Arctium lappa]